MTKPNPTPAVSEEEIEKLAEKIQRENCPLPSPRKHAYDKT